MDNDDTTFYVTVARPPYPVSAKKTDTFEKIWASEKCWFLPGDHVLIKDSNGNIREFVKE